MHSIIGKIAKQARHVGSVWSTDDWKRLLMDRWSREHTDAHARVVPALDGQGIVQLGLQTRALTKAQASDFVEFLYAWAAEHGIDVSED